MSLFRSIYLYASIHLLLMVSCHRSELSTEEMEQYILEEKNGLVKSSFDNNVTVQAIFRPGSLIAFQELKTVNTVSEQIVKEVKNHYSCNIYITVNISQEKQDPLYRLGGQVKYSEAVKQLAFGMAESAFLVTSNADTIRTADYVFPHMYGMSDAASVMFAFPMGKNRKYDWVDFELQNPGLDIGDRKFRFERSDIDKIPELKFTPGN